MAGLLSSFVDFFFVYYFFFIPENVLDAQDKVPAEESDAERREKNRKVRTRWGLNFSSIVAWPNQKNFSLHIIPQNESLTSFQQNQTTFLQFSDEKETKPFISRKIHDKTVDKSLFAASFKMNQMRRNDERLKTKDWRRRTEDEKKCVWRKKLYDGFEMEEERRGVLLVFLLQWRKGIITTPKRIALRKYRTEPFLTALGHEIKKVTGVHPKTPEKWDNPFEPHDLPGAMSRSWLSPNVFDTPLDTSPSFKWSIDHMATLHPVDIDHHDILRTEYLKHVQTESDEDDAQENILKFFDETGVHLPSPISHRGAHSPPDWSAVTSPARLSGLEVEFTKIRRGADVAVTDAQCQTDVQIPPNFDFEKYFADYQIMHHHHHHHHQRHRRSSSAVRRRLFMPTDMETSSTNLAWDVAANVSTGFVFGSLQSSSSQRPPSVGDDFPSDTEMECLWIQNLIILYVMQ